WSSDVCSSDLITLAGRDVELDLLAVAQHREGHDVAGAELLELVAHVLGVADWCPGHAEYLVVDLHGIGGRSPLDDLRDLDLLRYLDPLGAQRDHGRAELRAVHQLHVDVLNLLRGDLRRIDVRRLVDVRRRVQLSHQPVPGGDVRSRTTIDDDGEEVQGPLGLKGLQSLDVDHRLAIHLAQRVVHTGGAVDDLVDRYQVEHRDGRHEEYHRSEEEAGGPANASVRRGRRTTFGG